MKKCISVFLILIFLLTVSVGCTPVEKPDGTSGGDGTDVPSSGTPSTGGNDGDQSGDIGGHGTPLDELGAYDGYFEGESTDVTVTCVSGTPECYRLEGNMLTFTEVSENSVYAISGTLKGNIVIDIGDDYEFELELHGFSLVCDAGNPVEILSGDEVAVTAKKDTNNYIYDMRTAVDDEDDTLRSAALYAKVDLQLGGKGALTVVSENNNGVHTKDDLKVKNLTLLVACMDNALKGNDSVKITGGVLTLIARDGDGIKTKNSDLSSKGKQRGDVTLTGGEITIYAASDGIDAAHDVIVDDESVVLTIYTYSYSAYSDIDTSQTPDSGSQDTPAMPDMPNAPDAPNMPDMPDAPNMPDTPDMPSMPDAPDMPNPPEMPDTGDDATPLSSEREGMGGGWPGGGGMGGGQPGGQPNGGMGGPGGMPGPGGPDYNVDKIDVSAKGLKADNEITINAGTLNIQSYDDCLHANGGEELENGEASTGNIVVNGGTLTLLTKDDGIHADNILTVNGGTIRITDCYEGLEGTQVFVMGGDISVTASDDGINGTATSGTAITISGGTLYICAGGDAVDSNSKSSYEGIVFNGGDCVLITDSVVDSSIDTEAGYTYNGGRVLALMSSQAMTNEPTHCKNFSSVGAKSTQNLSVGTYVTVTIGADTAVVFRSPKALSALVVYLGDSSAKIASAAETELTLNADGIYWSK